MSLSLNCKLKNACKIASISCMSEGYFITFGKDCIHKLWTKFDKKIGYLQIVQISCITSGTWLLNSCWLLGCQANVKNNFCFCSLFQALLKKNIQTAKLSRPQNSRIISIYKVLVLFMIEKANKPNPKNQSISRY